MRTDSGMYAHVERTQSTAVFMKDGRTAGMAFLWRRLVVARSASQERSSSNSDRDVTGKMDGIIIRTGTGEK